MVQFTRLFTFLQMGEIGHEASLPRHPDLHHSNCPLLPRLSCLQVPYHHHRVIICHVLLHISIFVTSLSHFFVTCYSLCHCGFLMYLMLDAGDVATEPSFFPELNTKPIYFGSQQTLTITQNRYDGKFNCDKYVSFREIKYDIT